MESVSLFSQAHLAVGAHSLVHRPSPHHRAVVDANDEIEEGDEGNNVAWERVGP